MRWLLEDGGAGALRRQVCLADRRAVLAAEALLHDGALLIGDSASMCNAQNLSGIHMAIKTGMMAAETIVDALAKQDFTSKTLGGYAERYPQQLGLRRAPTRRGTSRPSIERGIAVLHASTMPLMHDQRRPRA